MIKTILIIIGLIFLIINAIIMWSCVIVAGDRRRK